MTDSDVQRDAATVPPDTVMSPSPPLDSSNIAQLAEELLAEFEFSLEPSVVLPQQRYVSESASQLDTGNTSTIAPHSHVHMAVLPSGTRLSEEARIQRLRRASRGKVLRNVEGNILSHRIRGKSTHYILSLYLCLPFEDINMYIYTCF